LLKTAAQDMNADVRIVNVSSNTPGIFFPAKYPLDYSQKEVYEGEIPPLGWLRRLTYETFLFDVMRYSVAKLAVTMFNIELQRLLDRQNIPILCISLNPGGVNSSGTGAGVVKAWARPPTKFGMMTPDQGSWHPLFAATATEVRQTPEKYKEQYLEPVGRVTTIYPLMWDENQRRALWEASTTELNKHLAKQKLPLLENW
jgi:NAD(P)-dependent dehydrogenase (short-subunit alcohol dehydrogenase family)